MEPKHASLAHEPLGGTPPSVGELVVQDGRLSGARRSLAAPMTLIGRAKGCHVRANFEGVGPFHCAIFQGPAGLILRDLNRKPNTLVNGTPVANSPLHDGDEIAVGPCRFRVRIASSPENTSPAQPAVVSESSQKEKEALRIQAAAVAAQQAALFEEETRLHQRRATLEQQEKELVAHLEDKRRRLLELRSQVHETHGAMRAEQTKYERRVAEMARRAEVERREIANGRRQTQTERQRLLKLQRKLKRRWHRSWAAEREALRRREQVLEDRRQELERYTETLNQERLHFNSEAELSRRSFQEGWDQLRREQGQWEERRQREQAELAERAGQLDGREANLAKSEGELTERQRLLEAKRAGLEKEVRGLEARTVNQRLKLEELERDTARLATVTQNLQKPPALVLSPLPPEPASAKDVASLSVPRLAAQPAQWFAENGEVFQTETDEREESTRLSHFDAVARALADQRVYLVEQWRRLLATQARWQMDREAVATELEVVGRRLQEREQTLHHAEERCRQRSEEAARLWRHLDGRQAQLTAQATAWVGERDRLRAELQAREIHLKRRLALVDGLRQLWHQRGRRVVVWLRAEFARCDQLRQEYSLLRRQWLQRTEVLADSERKLAQRVVTVEQYRQKYLAQGPAPAASGKRLEQLQRRLTGLFARAEAEVQRQREAMNAELARLEDRHRVVQEALENMARREAELSGKEAAWEQRRALTEAEAAKLRQEAASFHAQREVYEREIGALREEIERVVGRLLEDEGGEVREIGQAA